MGSSISTMVQSGLLALLLLGLTVKNCLGVSDDREALVSHLDGLVGLRWYGHPVPVICEDKWPEDKCIKMMEADKCEKVGKNCKLTCDMCDDGKCKDKMPSKKCKKIKEADKCDKNKDKCMKTCDFCDDHGSGSGESGEVGKCKDLMPTKKCIKFMEAGKCNDTKISKKCMKTCDMCEDEARKSPFELIDENGDGNITRGEWQLKIEKVMDKVMYITNITLTDDYEDLYDDIWEAMDCDNGTTINMEEWEILLDGKNQCGDDLDDWFHFALNVVVSVIQIVCSKDGYGPKWGGYGGYGYYGWGK